MIVYVLIGNVIIGIKGMTIEYWVVLFSVSCFANIIGLNISASFNSAVTIYILIPLIVIPQMALGGAMFNFDKINKIFGGGNGKAPVIADFMASRWAYEALAVTQFKNNRHEQKFYDIEQIESFSNYRQVYYIPELKKVINESVSLLEKKDDISSKRLTENLNLHKNEFSAEMAFFSDLPVIDNGKFTNETFTTGVAKEAQEFVTKLEERYIKIFNLISKKKDNLIISEKNETSSGQGYLKSYDTYYNDFLADIVKKTNEKNKMVRVGAHLIQTYEPIFLMPVNERGLSLRTHFFAPVKFIFGKRMDTLMFNIIIIWIMSILFYTTLYYDILRKIVNMRGRKNSKDKMLL